MSIGNNLAKQAIERSAYYIPALFGREVAQHSNWLKQGFKANLGKDVLELPVNQFPLAVDKKLKENWAMRPLLWYCDWFRPKVGKKIREFLNPPANFTARRLHAFKPDAQEKIGAFLKENCEPQLKALTHLDDQVAKSWWPRITFYRQFSNAVERLTEQVFDKAENLKGTPLLETPEKIEEKIIQGLQDELHKTKVEAHPGQTLQQFNEAMQPLKPKRGQLLRDLKEALAQLKLNAGEQSNAILTRLAKESLQKGQVDTIQLLKEAGADAAVIQQEAAQQGIHLKAGSQKHFVSSDFSDPVKSIKKNDQKQKQLWDLTEFLRVNVFGKFKIVSPLVVK